MIPAIGSRGDLSSPHLRDLRQLVSRVSPCRGFLVVPSIPGTKTHILPKTEAKPSRFLEKVVQNLYTEFRVENLDRGGVSNLSGQNFLKK